MRTTNKRYKLYREIIYAPQSRYMRLFDRYMSAAYDTANGADCSLCKDAVNTLERSADILRL